MLDLGPKTIYVTQEDIHQGVCKDKESCAIALALADEYKEQIDYVEVSSFDSIKMSGKNDMWYRIELCEDDEFKVQTFIDNFDDGKQVQPISFRIDEIEEY